MNTKAVIYCRVSSKEQEETGYSLPAQEKLLTDYATRKNIEIAKVFSVAESASGAKQRKIFAEMMEYIEKHDIPVLLCEKVDRLTRNLKEAVTANDWIEVDPKRQIHFVKQNLVIHLGSKSDEKFRWDIEIVLAKKFISNLSEEVKKGQEQKIRSGWLPTKPPLGYKTIGEKGHKIHVIDQEKAPFIKKLFEYYSTGNYSMKRVVEQLYTEGFRTHAGGKPVKSKIESLLKDPFYYGAIRWNDVVHTGGRHEPLITKELFDKAQEIRSGKKASAYSKHEFQFRKMVTCAECKGTVTAEIQKGIIYYHCNHYRNCQQKKYTPEEILEQKLFGVFKFFENITSEEAEQIKAEIKANHAQEIEYKESTLKSLNDRYGQLQRRLDNLYNDRLDETITMDFWQKKQKDITDEQNAIQDQIKKLKSEEAKYFEIWLNILDLARRAREIYEKRSPAQRRVLLNHIFSSLTLSDEGADYKLKAPVQKLAERVQKRIDEEKTFERTQKTAGSVASSGDLRSSTHNLPIKLPVDRNNFRTTKKPSVRTRHEASGLTSRSLLRR